MPKIPHKPVHRPSVEHGMNDSDFPSQVATTQVSIAQNFDLSSDGRYDSRGGSQKISASPTAVGEDILLEYEYRSVSAGVVTRNHMVFAGTRLLKYDPSNKTYTEIADWIEENL